MMFFSILSGFDGCLDTPVEILHVFLLGVVKYLTRDFMKGLKACHLERLMASWESFNKNSLNIDTINSVNMAKHHGSFVGKHFRIVLQAVPFIFYQFMTESNTSSGFLCVSFQLIISKHALMTWISI
jgi:hypothetical protein